MKTMHILKFLKVFKCIKNTSFEDISKNATCKQFKNSVAVKNESDILFYKIKKTFFKFY